MAGAADEAPLLVFLFASPLVRERKDAAGNVRLGPSAQLDADVELTELHRMLTDCGKAIRLRSKSALSGPAARQGAGLLKRAREATTYA